jgi:hypothetical protein
MFLQDGLEKREVIRFCGGEHVVEFFCSCFLCRCSLQFLSFGRTFKGVAGWDSGTRGRGGGVWSGSGKKKFDMGA